MGARVVPNQPITRVKKTVSICCDAEDTGISVYDSRVENVENTDVFLWRSFGITHITRPRCKPHLGFCRTFIYADDQSAETSLIDFPMMPAEKLASTLKPVRFFDLNPSNDVPRSNRNQNQSTQHQHAPSSLKSCFAGLNSDGS